MNPSDISLRVPTRGAIQITTLHFLLYVRKEFPTLDMALYEEHLDVASVRNRIVKDFLKNSSRSFLILVDDDVLPPATLLSLPDWNKPIVSGVYSGVKPDSTPFPHIYIKSKESYQAIPDQKWGSKELLECDGVGAGMLCIRRDVLKNPKVLRGGPFTMPKDWYGINKFSDDFAFCQKVQRAGYKIYVDLSCVGDHRVGIQLLPIMTAYSKLFVERLQQAKDGTWDPNEILQLAKEEIETHA